MSKLPAATGLKLPFHSSAVCPFLNTNTLLNACSIDDFSGTDLEKCVLVYEVFTNIGDRLYDDFLDWNNGYCRKYDIQKEQKALEDRLLAKYGELTIF